MKLTLNIHGSLASLYRNFYNTDELPNNLCAYFWKLVVAIIFFLPCYPMLAINHFSNPIKYRNEYNSYWENGSRIPNFLGAFVNFLFLVFGVIFTSLAYGDETVRYMAIWKCYLNGIIGSFLFAGVIIGIIALIVWLYNREGTQKSFVEMTPDEWQEYQHKEQLRALKKERSFWTLTKKAFIAWKTKNCPIITWSNEK